MKKLTENELLVLGHLPDAPHLNFHPDLKDSLRKLVQEHSDQKDLIQAFVGVLEKILDAGVVTIGRDDEDLTPLLRSALRLAKEDG